LIEFDVELNSIPIDDGLGKDITVNWKMYNGFDPHKTFWTDSNSLEMQRREILDLPTGRKAVDSKPGVNYMTIARNFFPINGAISMRDKNNTDQLFGWDDSTAAIFKTAKKEEHVNPLSSICFHAGSKAGDWVYLRPCNATDTLQQWSAVQGPPLATMAIVPKAHPSSCLDLLGQSALDGTSIVTEKCVAGLISQQWFFDAGSWRIRSALNPKKCIDWQSIKGDPKGNLNLNTCAANSTSQLFGWDANTSAIFESPEKGSHAKIGSMCFRAGSNNGGNVTVRGCNGTDTLQQWSATFRLPGTALVSILV